MRLKAYEETLNKSAGYKYNISIISPERTKKQRDHVETVKGTLRDSTCHTARTWRQK